jgi:hypothetical protein
LHDLKGQSGFCGFQLDGPRPHLVQTTAIRPYPNVALQVFGQAEDAGMSGGNFFELDAREAKQSAKESSDPYRSLAVFDQRARFPSRKFGSEKAEIPQCFPFREFEEAKTAANPDSSLPGRRETRRQRVKMQERLEAAGPKNSNLAGFGEPNLPGSITSELTDRIGGWQPIGVRKACDFFIF